MLRRPAATLSHWLADACLDERGVAVDIFTINHDTIIERHFEKQGIDYADGFADTGNVFKDWTPSLYDLPNHRVRLFKLHGSINWFQYPRHESGHMTRLRTVTPVSADALLSAEYPRPVILVGTLNKPLVCMNTVFSELHCRFHHALEAADLLIVVGFGFGDQGINLRMIPWIRGSVRNKVVVIDPGIENLKSSVWPWTFNDWRELELDGDHYRI